MAVRFAATLNAFNRGIEEMKPRQAISMIEDWETALAEVDIPGTKGIARDLGALKRQLEANEPDESRIDAILARLGDAVTKIAPKADRNQDKLEQLGRALSESGQAEDDEDEDQEAAAAPKRRSRRQTADA